jgi:acyl-CoA thioesterase-2
VTGIQNGQAIFSMTASFHRLEEGKEHHAPMPEAPPPEELPRELDLIREIADRIPPRLRGILTQERPIDFRPVDPADFFQPEPRAARQMMWLRALGEIGGGQLEHQAVLAYASDYGLLATALLPHGLTIRMPRLQVASLDHSIWFHRPLRVNDWLLYVMDSPNAAGARGFARGTVYTRSGELVASVAQEGLMRIRD